MSENQSSKDIYYEEVLTTAALALSQSKKGTTSSSSIRDGQGRIRLRHSPYSDNHHQHRHYAHSDSYNTGIKLNSPSIKSDHDGCDESRVCKSDSCSNTVWNRDLPTCHGLSRESLISDKDHDDEQGQTQQEHSKHDQSKHQMTNTGVPGVQNNNNVSDHCGVGILDCDDSHKMKNSNGNSNSSSSIRSAGNTDNEMKRTLPSKMGHGCDSRHEGNHKHYMSPVEAELLASLPSRPIANFPSESDRKRVIGMLATIISTMYQYEEDDCVMDYSPNTIPILRETQQQQQDEGKGDQTAAPPFNIIDFPSVSTAQFAVEPSTSNDESFEEMLKPSYPRQTNSEEKQAPCVHGNKRLQKSDSCHQSNKNLNRGYNNRLLSKRRSSSIHSSQSHLQSKDQCRQENVIMRRYRQRRHSVYSKFLVSAAGLLFLDKSNAIAFLPLLNKLLGGDDIDENAYIESWNRHGTVNEGYGKDGDNSRRNHCNDPYSQQCSTKENQEKKEKEITRHGSNTARKLNSIFDSHRKQKTLDHEKQPWDENDILMPFVESLEPGAGVQCLSLLLLNYLLQSRQGYDARIRACIKKLGVIIFSHELKHSDCEEVEERIKVAHRMGKSLDDCLTEMATRKFESLEHTIASKLLRISAAQQQRKEGTGKVVNNVARTRREITREKIMRGLKIGTAGVAAGTLMAVTGGLAAPGIAAGLAATGITTAATAGVVTTLTSTAAVTTIFGVGGGGLAAYKTHRRTKGVTEFTFQKQQHNSMEKDGGNAELFTTICISGWLKDEKDFERPWGVEPSNPPITDKLEKLIRFYSIHKPENIERCQEILKRWKGEEKELWSVLSEKYGQDPDHVYPIYNSPNKRIVLTHEEDEVVDRLLGELGYSVPHEEIALSALSEMKQKMYSMNVNESTISMRSMRQSDNADTSFSTDFSDSENSQHYDQDGTRHANQIWDYKMEYGGELLTVKWESEMLVELCDSVADMAADMAGQAAREILKQTALATLITAVALPYAIVRAADMIDGTWTLAIERSDLAGIELAKSLLESEAGHRPVVLIGFSMGARVIYSCLKELARQQEIWEEQEEAMRSALNNNKEKRHKMKFPREPASIVEDAIIMGLPNHLSLHSWESCRRVVAGRLVNCYSKKDMILSLMFQIKRLTGALRPVCGTSPVRVRGVENYNVERLISAHSDYCAATGHILRMIYHGTPHRSSASIVVPSYATNHGYRIT
jgi:hypothetical protein